MTLRGFCALAPESRNTRPGLLSKIGNSRRNRRGSSRPGLTSSFRSGAAAISLLQIAEPHREPPHQMLADKRLLHAFHDLPQKPLHHHPPRLFGRDAAGAQIEQRRLVEIADAGAVAALDVVGVDFELGLGVYDRPLADDQIAAQLVCVDLLRPLAHDDAALERAMRAPGSDALDQLACLAA